MRGIASRRINREPVRSPSPDISNRNIIVFTTPPAVQQVLSRSRSRYDHSVSPSFCSGSIEDMQRAYTELQDRYKGLERYIGALMGENGALKREVGELKDLMKRNKPGFLKPIDQHEQDINLREYESRIQGFYEENKRIQGLLRAEQERREQLQIENGKLRQYDPKSSRKQWSSYTGQPPRSVRYQDDIPADNQFQQINTPQSNGLRYVEQTINNNFQNIKREYELKVHLSLNAMSQRLAKAERKQTAIQQMVNRPQFRTPRVVKQSKEYQYSTQPGKRSVSPAGDPKRFYRTGLLEEQDRKADLARQQTRQGSVPSDLARLNRENEALREKVREFQSQLDRIGRDNQTLRERAKQAQIELQRSLRDLEQLHDRGRVGQTQTERLAKQVGSLRYQLQMEKERAAKIREPQILPECQNCKYYLGRVDDLEKELQRLRQYKSQEQLERKTNIRQEVQRSSQKFTLNLQDYLRRIKEIKTLLNNPQFREFVDKVNELINQNINLSDKLERVLQERDRLGREGRNREIQLKLQVRNLTRENQILKTQVRGLEDQVREQKQIIDQLSKQQNTVIKPFEVRKSSSDPKLFQGFIQEAIHKLQSLEQTIGNTLRE